MNSGEKFEQKNDLISQDEFVEELKSGSEVAFKLLINENQKKIYHIALSMVKNPTEAEDVAQDVFVKIYTSIGTFNGNSSLSTWMYKITYHMALDHLKKKNRQFKRFKTLDDPEDTEIISLSDDKFVPEREFEDKELKDDLMNALRQLPEEQRILVELKDIHGFSYEEIIEITGLKDGTMKSRLNRARISLRKKLQSKWNF